MTFLPSLMPEQGHLDELDVLVAVANDHTARLILQRQPGKQFRFAADFQAKMERLAGIEDFLHHFAQLVDFDRKHAAIVALIIEFLDRSAEGEVDGFDAMAQDVLKADQQRKFQTAAPRLLDDISDIHRGAGLLQGFGDDVAGLVDIEILRTPALDVIKIAGCLDIPGRKPGVRTIHDYSSNQRTIGMLTENSIEVMKKSHLFSQSPSRPPKHTSRGVKPAPGLRQ